MSSTDVNVTGNLQDIQPDEFYYYAVLNDSDRTIEGQKSFSLMTGKYARQQHETVVFYSKWNLHKNLLMTK